MLLHYFKITWRNLSMHKGLAFINVFGLSVGIACFSLFLLYAVNELNFDTFHKNANNIYRVYEWVQGMNSGEPGPSTSLPMPLAGALKKDLPDVMNAVRIRGDSRSLVKVDKTIQRVPISYVDPEFFSVFSFPLQYGNSVNPLQELHSLVLTVSTAKQLFGTVNVIGRSVQVKTDSTFEPFTITAIAADVPANSSVQFSALANFNFLETTQEGKDAGNNWHRSAYQTFVLLKPGSSLPTDEKRWIQFRHTYYPTEEIDMKKNGMKWKAGVPPIVYQLQPIAKMHTDTKLKDYKSIDPVTIWILLSIASGVLLIACINFTTLAIGRSAGRSKEVGVRKVLGSGKKQLIFQFVAEACFLSVLSTVLGVLFAAFLLPYFNQLSGRQLQFSFTLYPQLIWLFAVLALVIGLLTGSYPALVLSSFKPIEALKNKIKIGGANFFTKSLVTLQFALSIGLIVSTVIILQQTHYMSGKNPGFNKENVILVNASETDTKKIYPLFKQAMAQHPEISGVTNAAIGLGEGEDFWVTGFKYHDKPVYCSFNPVDVNYIDVMGMQVIAGRNFDPQVSKDTINSVIINEAMMKEFGWNLQSAIGQQLDGFSPDKTPVVIGVVKNFNFESVAKEVGPQMFAPFFDPEHPKFYVRINSGNPAKALALIQQTWSSLLPNVPIDYSFIDERLDAYYKAEQRWSSIVGWAGGISIFLACLGLFGLAALATINRVKEIGIRKVMGASVTDIITLISKDFIKLILVALFIATPATWYFMSHWLQTFAYRIDISLFVFIFTGMFVIFIALMTIFFQAIKAAVANPVNSLRTE